MHARHSQPYLHMQIICMRQDSIISLSLCFSPFGSMLCVCVCFTCYSGKTRAPALAAAFAAAAAAAHS